jgi:hypothetical protein
MNKLPSGSLICLIVALAVVLVGARSAGAEKPPEAKNNEWLAPGSCPVAAHEAVKASVGATLSDTVGTVTTAPLQFDPRAGFVISDVVIGVDIQHTWVGDLVVQLRHTSSSNDVTTVDLLHRPGVPTETFGCAGDLVSNPEDRYYFGTVLGLSPLGEADCPSVILGGCYAVAPGAIGLEIFRGQPVGDGHWELIITDNAAGDDGMLHLWSLHVLSEPGALSVGDKSWGSVKARYHAP